jgi:hypothetical protein
MLAKTYTLHLQMDQWHKESFCSDFKGQLGRLQSAFYSAGLQKGHQEAMSDTNCGAIHLSSVSINFRAGQASENVQNEISHQ